MDDADNIYAGVRFIRSNPAILGTISLDLFAVLLGGATALLPIYARDILHAGPWALGVMRAAPAVGALVMTAVLTRHPLSLVQLATPDEMRGRVGAVNFLFIHASNQLGEFESGLTAALIGAMPAALIGGLGTIAVALLWMKLFPSLRKVERLE